MESKKEENEKKKSERDGERQTDRNRDGSLKDRQTRTQTERD